MSESNIFIILNLGCEMLYVIEQRLQAQNVEYDKSTQVMKDITSVLLDPKFLHRLTNDRQDNVLISQNHCRKMLNEVACCSLMRLDEASMGKLWDLMLMIFKWQLFVSKYPQHLLDITFRHLDGVAQLYPDVKKTMLVDYTKDIILDYWNRNEEENQTNMFRTIKQWMNGYNVKISILIRLGFQSVDGTLLKNVEVKHFEDFVESAGENIYNKNFELSNAAKETDDNLGNSKFDCFVSQLNVEPISCDQSIDVMKRNIVFEDFSLLNLDEIQDEPVEISEEDNSSRNTNKSNEFVKISTLHTASSSSWENDVASRRNSYLGKDLKDLLNTKL